MALKDNFTISESCLRSFVLKISSKNESSTQSFKSLKLRCLIVLLLLISGNVQPNPGPDSAICLNTPADFKSRAGLGFIHLNVRSLIAKTDMFRIWAYSTEADVIVLSETWLSKSVLNEDISIDGYNVYRTDRPRRGGGVAVYIKNKFRVNMLLSKSVSKQFEFLALDLEVSRTLHITVVGCYRTPSAVRDALPSLMQLLSGLNQNEIVVIGDLNWNWLHPVSDEFKAYCDSLNLFQLVDSPTRPNLKCPDKSSLIDLILTNVPYKYSAASVLQTTLVTIVLLPRSETQKFPKPSHVSLLSVTQNIFRYKGFYMTCFILIGIKCILLQMLKTLGNFFMMVFMNC